LPNGDEMTTLVIVDCEKTRKARDRWRAEQKNSRLLKNLGAAAQLSRLLGTEGGLEAPYSRVTLRSLVAFAEKVKRTWQEFQADLTTEEYDRWCRDWEAEREASRQAKNSTAPTQHGQIDALHSDLRGYYELYHQATAKKFSNEISLSLMHIDGIDVQQSVVKCELYDNNKSGPSFQLSGRIAPRHGFLFWELGSNSLTGGARFSALERENQHAHGNKRSRQADRAHQGHLRPHGDRR
jgi:hypothetical protein